MEADTGTLRVEWVDIDQVFLNPANPRHNDEAVPQVAASLRRFGWRQPIVVKPSGEVIAGNTRLKAAKALGMKRVPVTRFEGPDIEAVAYAIADNRTHEFAEWDEPALARILQELQAEDALDGVGFTDADLDDLAAQLDALDVSVNEIEDPGAEEPPENPVSRTGDLWILDHHRLLCGDSTKSEDLARLMDGRQAVLLSTDPPYCVNYTGMDRPIHDGKPSGKDWSHLYREVDIEDLGQFLDAVFSSCLPHVKTDAAIYVWHAHVQQPVIAATFEKHGLLLHQVLVWVKPTATFGHSYYRWRHEPCAFSGWKKGHKPNHGLGKLESVWEVDWEGKSRVVGRQRASHDEAPAAFRDPHGAAHPARPDRAGAVLRIRKPDPGRGAARPEMPGPGDPACVRGRGHPSVGKGDRKESLSRGDEPRLRGSGQGTGEPEGRGVMARRKLPVDAFEHYFALGHERSYRAVADHYRVSKTAVANLAEREKWQAQVIARERQAREALEQKSVETLEQMNERHIKLCKLIQKKALDALRSMPISAAMEAVRAMDLSIKQERLVRGEPTDRNAVDVEQVIKREYERWLEPVEDEDQNGGEPVTEDHGATSEAKEPDEGGTS